MNNFTCDLKLYAVVLVLASIKLQVNTHPPCKYHNIIIIINKQEEETYQIHCQYIVDDSK